MSAQTAVHAASPVSARPTGVGELIRQWRKLRRVSQLDLSIEAEISTRHLSFVETGRSKPSPEMILRLSEHLDIPLRERNHLLLAGGFAPAFPEHDIDSPELGAARVAVRQVLLAHEPNPALAVDRTWNIVDTNSCVAVFTDLVQAPELLQGTVNALRLTLHPHGMARHIVNLHEWRVAVLGGLRRSALARADADMLALYDELCAYPGGDPVTASSQRGAVHVPFRIRVADDRVLSFMAVIATFGTALDITLSELAIETFFPADDATAVYVRSRFPVPG